MRLFGLPGGTRLFLMTDHVVAVADDASTLRLDRRQLTRATATNEFATVAGQLRRRFTQADPPLAEFTSDVWMADGDYYP